MSLNNKANRKRRVFYVTAAIAGVVALSGIETTKVSAASQERASLLDLIEISAQDAAPAESLKKELIADRVELDPSVSSENLEVASSRIDLSGFDRNKAGLQTVTAQVYLDSGKDPSLSYSFTEKKTILVTKENAPQIQLKSDEVVVNNSDAWNPFYYISYINDDSKVLPAVKVEGKVDMSTDGDYPVTYAAVDQQGNISEARLTVKVRTPEEVIQAREEAERLAREEEERRIAEEQAAAERAAEEERLAQEAAQQERMQAAAAITYSGAPGSATGSAIADSARAWAGVGYYVWGGSNPATGADCSGFTQYIYSQYGISLPHNNLAQAAAGYPVSAAEAQPGDLVIWDAHVGIYTGNGYYVSALNEGVGIIEIPISASSGSGSYWGIYRIPGAN
jgi:cell wall-associated NlpC family hydrolase